MSNRQLLTTAGTVIEVLRKLTTDINQMRSMFLAIEDRAMDGGGGLEEGSIVAIHLETLARIGGDIADRNVSEASDTICALQAVINASKIEGEAA